MAIYASGASLCVPMSACTHVHTRLVLVVPACTRARTHARARARMRTHRQPHLHIGGQRNGCYICIWMCMCYICIWLHMYMDGYHLHIGGQPNGCYICIWMCMCYICIWMCICYICTWLHMYMDGYHLHIGGQSDGCEHSFLAPSRRRRTYQVHCPSARQRVQPLYPSPCRRRLCVLPS